MFIDEDYDPSYYYEPSDADNVLNEAMKVIEGILNKKIKHKFGNLEKKSEELNNERDLLNKKEVELRNRERTIKLKERELNTEFNKRKLADIYEELMKSFGEEFFKIDKKLYKKEKCNLCDSSRKVTIKAPCGQSHEVYCSCNNSLVNYSVSSDYYIKLSIWKSHGKEYRKLQLANINNDDERAYFSDINSSKIINEYDDSLEGISWKHFSSKELTQKYCDLLNERQNQKQNKRK